MLYKLNQPAMNYSQTNMYTLGLAELFELMQSLLGYFQGFLVGKCTVEHNVILFLFLFIWFGGLVIIWPPANIFESSW